MHPVVVIGDGWAALGAAGFLATSGISVCWISGSGARVLAPLACLEAGPGISAWGELASKLGLSVGEAQTGSFVREFRNKAFREPAWTKSPTPETRLETRDESLWAPERRMIGAFDARFGWTLGEIEDEIRKILLSGNFANLRRIEGVPVTSIKKEDGQLKAVVLGSGEEIECEQVIYADRWTRLLEIEGMPKPLPFLRKRDPMGVLQATFSHQPSLGEGILESFFAAIHRDSGEDVERHVWGYFSQDGKKSTWTLCLSPEQVEDNHEIAKKLRRMKNTLDKIFTNNTLLPAGSETFASTVIEEQVRFEEEAFFAEGEPFSEPFTIPQLNGVLVLSDGYGPSWSLRQVGEALGIQASRPDAETENMDFANP